MTPFSRMDQVYWKIQQLTEKYHLKSRFQTAQQKIQAHPIPSTLSGLIGLILLANRINTLKIAHEIEQFIQSLDEGILQEMYFTITPIIDHPSLYDLLTIAKISPSIKDNLAYLQIPDDYLAEYQTQYHLLEQKSHTMLPFSLEDFTLAYLSAEDEQWCVISYDNKDLFRRIAKYLEYDVFFPEQASEISKFAFALLDTNILIELSNHSRKKSAILEMVRSNPQTTFIFPNFLTHEFERYVQSDETIWSRQDDIAIHLEPGEEDLSQFIDDFEGFQSPNKTRRKTKKRKKKKHYRDSYRGRWADYV